MNPETIALITLSAVSAMLVLLGAALFHNGATMRTRCSACTDGTVEGWSQRSLGDFNLLRIAYTVDGKRHRLAGPNFTSVVYSSVSLPWAHVETEFKTNLDAYDPANPESLPTKLRYRSRGNSFVRVTETSLLSLFPKGSTVPVFYDPKHPGDAYAVRWCRPVRQTMGASILICGAALALISAIGFVAIP